MRTLVLAVVLLSRMTPMALAVNIQNRPIALEVIEPECRDTIYSSAPVEAIKAAVSINFPAAKLTGATVQTCLTNSGKTLFSASHAPKPRLELTIPAKDLAEGDYQLTSRLVDADGKPIATAERTIRKLGPPPAIEVRINRAGTMIVNGTPLFVRGWYGNFDFEVPDTTLPAARLPRTVNFMMGGRRGEREFSNEQAFVHRVMQTGHKAIGGRAKALWSTPGVFSYGYDGSNAGTGQQSVFPDFYQTRWILLSPVANRAMGLAPYAFGDAWSDVQCSVTTDYVYETLFWLEVPWVEGQDVPVEPVCTGGGAVDATARRYAPPNGIEQVYIIATNRDGKNAQATFTLDSLKRHKRVFVVREDRTIEVSNGAFTDDFGPIGAHVYTTNNRMPWMKSLDEISAEIAAVRAAPANGNLLRDGKTDWSRGVEGRNARIYGDALADGCVDRRGWFPWYGQRKELTLVFPDSVTFKKFVFYSANVGAAHLETWYFGRWIELAKWNEITGYKNVWEGKPCKTVKIRLIIDEIREGDRPYAYSIPDISEIEMY